MNIVEDMYTQWASVVPLVICPVSSTLEHIFKDVTCHAICQSEGVEGILILSIKIKLID